MKRDSAHLNPPIRRRALVLLASCPDGCTKAVLAAHNIPDDIVQSLSVAGLPVAHTEAIGGRTRLQPAYVEDVAEAIARALQRTQTHAITFECGGPRVYSYEELLRALAREADLKRILIPLPFAAGGHWHGLQNCSRIRPSPAIKWS
jgi:uncharacterized protein YbjT (DUF2867 family)